MLDKIALQRSTFLVNNILENSDFKNNAKGWNALFIESSFDDGILTLTSEDSTASRLQRSPNTSYQIGDILYWAANIKADKSNIGVGTAGVLYVSHTGSGDWERISTTRNSVYDSIALSIVDKNNDSNTFYVKNYIVVNLTETFGKGNEPTAKQMDELLSQFDGGWFDGTKNVFNAEHILKMYFNKTKDLDNAITSLGGSI